MQQMMVIARHPALAISLRKNSSSSMAFRTNFFSVSRQGRYTSCTDFEYEKNESLTALDNMDPDYTGKKAGIEAMHAKKHNAALDELTAVADRWSQELKAYSAAQKK